MQTILPFIIGWLVLLLILWAFVRGVRHPQSRRPPTPLRGTVDTPLKADPSYPYSRGTDLYRRSYNHRSDTVQVRIAMGLPPQHNEPMWRSGHAPHRPTPVSANAGWIACWPRLVPRGYEWATMWAIRNKTDVAQVNELLCKVLCHNICVVIQSMFELGIEAEFGG